MKPTQYLDALRRSLDAERGAKSAWSRVHKWDSARWTTAMTRSLGAAAHEIFPNAHVAGKDIDSSLSYCDPYERREYLSLDLTVYDNANWTAPLMIAEHEISPSPEKVQYCAWKLLSVHADVRLLVAYFDSTGKYADWVNSADAVEGCLKEVVRDHKDKPLFLLAGDWSRDWNRIFEIRTLGTGGY
jgi:hypothetical protein